MAEFRKRNNPFSSTIIFLLNITGPFARCLNWFLTPANFILIGLVIFSPIQVFGEQNEFLPYKSRTPYVSPPHVPPPVTLNELRNRFIDNGDGTITDKISKLMWARADSFSVLKKCINWKDAKNYISGLQLGGFKDWDMPTVDELLSLYDSFEENAIAYDRDPNYPLGLNKIFSEGAAYLFWSKDKEEYSDPECCAKSVYFYNGLVTSHRLDMCAKSGVRGVRRIE